MKHVYKISDLRSRGHLDDGAAVPARLAVIGSPVAHSASPGMHQAALDACGLDMRYIRLEVAPGEVAEAFRLMAGLGFIGCNVTVPHKLEAMECCTLLSEGARALRAVNTVVFPSQEQSETAGYNTDGPGLARAVREDFDVEIADLRVLVLGAGGGAGKAIATQCALLGCRRLWLANRSVDKAHSLAAALQKAGKREQKIQALGSDAPALEKAAVDTDLIINATSLGMRENDPLPLPGSCVTPRHLVYDAIYQPPETALLKQAKNAGARTSNGLSMLLHQGVLAFEQWFPGHSPVEAMRRGLLAGVQS